MYVHMYANIYVTRQIYVELFSAYMLTYRILTFI